MIQFEDYAWLGSEDGYGVWEKFRIQNSPEQWLRGTTLSPGRKQLLLEQLRLHAWSRDKTPNYESWFWTKRLLEQASDHWCANETADDFPEKARVYDLCCGSGSDAVALSHRGLEVLAIDKDPIACELTRMNASREGCDLRVMQHDVVSMNLDPGASVNIDPDRRGGKLRTCSIDAFQPAWDTVKIWIRIARCTSLKVAPASQPPTDDAPDVIRFISRSRGVRQQRWIWNTDRWPVGSRVVSSLHHGAWAHEIFERPWTGVAHERITTETVREYIGDYDPALRAARMSEAFAIKTGCELLDREGGYLVACQPIRHPMIQWFRVEEVLPLDKKRLIAMSRTRRSRAWELKSKHVEIDLPALQKSLVKSECDEEYTILFAAIRKRHIAIVAQRTSAVA